MTTGLFSTEKAKTTAQAGIAEASSTFAPKGAIVAESNGMWAGPPRFVQWIYIQVTLATGATDASIDREDLAFIYTDDHQRHSIKASKLRSSETGIISRIIIRKIVGEVPFSLLREGEVAEIAIELNKTHEGVGHDCNGCIQLGANQQFRIEIIPPAGGSLIIARKTPPGIQKVMNLE